MTERKKEIPPIVATIGENITTILKQKGMLLRHLSAKADMDIEAVRKYVKGKQIMGVDKLYIIAQALEVGVEDLFKPTEKIEK